MDEGVAVADLEAVDKAEVSDETMMKDGGFCGQRDRAQLIGEESNEVVELVGLRGEGRGVFIAAVLVGGGWRGSGRGVFMDGEEEQGQARLRSSGELGRL